MPVSAVWVMVRAVAVSVYESAFTRLMACWLTWQWGADAFTIENVSVHPAAVAPGLIVPAWSVESPSSAGEVPQPDSVGVPPPKCASPALSIIKRVEDARVEVVVDTAIGTTPATPAMERVANGVVVPIPTCAAPDELN